MSGAIDSSTPENAMRHVIDSAIFGFTFDPGSLPWPDELELAKVVEKELLLVVNDVFDEHSRTSGAVRIDKLEVDLGSLVFDGSWGNLREQLRTGLQLALVRAEQKSTVRQGGADSPLPSERLPATRFDLLEQFLRFGVLPRQVQIRDRRDMDALLQEMARVEPHRLTALIRDDAVGKSVAKRLVSQFPDALVHQVIAAINPGAAAVTQTLTGQLDGQAAELRLMTALTGVFTEDADVTQTQTIANPVVAIEAEHPALPRLEQIRSELERGQSESLDWLLQEMKSGALPLTAVTDDLSTEAHRRLFEGIVAITTRQSGGALELQQAIAGYARRVGNERSYYRQLLKQLLRDELIDLEAIAARSMDADDRNAPRPVWEQQALPDSQTEPIGQSTGSERLLHAYDLYAALVDPVTESAGEKARRSEIIDALLRDHPQLFQRLLLELRSGVVDLPLITGRLSEDGLRRLLRAVVRSARGSAAADRRQFLRSIDHHARRAGNADRYYRQVLQRLVREEPVDLEAIAAGKTQSAPAPATPVHTDSNLPAQQMRDYAGDATAPPGRNPGASRRAAEHLLAVEPRWLAQFLRRSLTDEKAIARLLELLPERLLTRALFLLAPALHERIQRSADTIANACDQVQTGITAAQITKLKWQFCCQYLLTAGLHWNTDLFVNRFAEFLAVHSNRLDAEQLYVLLRQAPVDRETLASQVTATDTPPLARQNLRDPDAYAETDMRIDSSEVDATGLSTTPMDLESNSARLVLHNYLDDGTLSPGASLKALRQTAGRLLKSEPRLSTGFLRQSLTGEQAIARLVELLPETLLTRALKLLAPELHERMLHCADALLNASITLPPGISTARINRLKWQLCLQQLLAAEPHWKADLLLQRFASLLALDSAKTDATELYSLLRQRLSDGELTAPVDTDSSAAKRTLRDYFDDATLLPVPAVDTDPDQADAGTPLSPAATQRRLKPETSKAERQADDARQNRELLEAGIRVANAGQVLAAPYLPRLFGMLDLVKDGTFTSPEAQERAVHLLQFMVDESCDTPEYGLLLNKLLCGLETVASVQRELLLTSAEKEAVEGLLRGMIQNWQALGKTSVGGFRESFLQRAGTLRLDHDGWHLVVEPKAFDMLLDRIPWSFSIIKHAWMNEVLYVDWR